MVLKDKPILSPLRIFRPSTYASGELFPFPYALGWWIAIQALAWLEPVPAELDIQFNWKYLAFQHVCAIAAQILLPLVFLQLLPRDLPGGRVRSLVRLSFGACFWYFWTFPLTFLLDGVPATLALELGRPLLWAGTVAWVAAGLSSSGRGRWPVILAGTPGLLLGCILLSLVPDWTLLRHIHMENIQSGKICSGIPMLTGDRVAAADWRLSGATENITEERVGLGARQRRIAGEPGNLLVRVDAAGGIPMPADTTGTLETSVGDWTLALRRWLGMPGPHPRGTELFEEILARVPPSSDSLRLQILHALVHGSIKYQRTYFPGGAAEILERGTGDCKAFAEVFCAGARRLGFRAKVVHGLLASPDGYYAHAWVTVRLSDGRWMDWDPTSGFPFPDARYLRFSAPGEAAGAFDGELAIFSLDSVRVSTPGSGLNFLP